VLPDRGSSTGSLPCDVVRRQGLEAGGTEPIADGEPGFAETDESNPHDGSF